MELAFMVMLGLGFFLYPMAYKDAFWYEDYALDGTYGSLVGTVVGKSPDTEGEILILGDCRLTVEEKDYETNDIRLKLSGEEENLGEIHIGDLVKAEGTIPYYRLARNPGNFNERDYYASLGIDFTVEPAEVQVLEEHENIYREFLYQLKKKLRQVYIMDMTEEDAGVMDTMVLGDKSILDAQVKALYQQSGISHILAISGLHISVVGLLVYRLLRRLRVSYLVSGLVGGFLVFSFGSMSGMGLSATRAVSMFIIMVLGNVRGRAYDSLTAMALAGIYLLVRSPLSLFTASFQLSFSAVLGAVVVAPLLMDLGGRKRGIWSSFFLCLAIQLVTVPISLYYYFELPLYSILINLLLLPLTGTLLVTGILGGLVGLWSFQLAGFILFPCHLILGFYQACCSFFTGLRGHSLIEGRPALWVIGLYYFILLMGLFLMKSLMTRRRESFENRMVVVQKKIERTYSCVNVSLTALGGLGLLALGLIIFGIHPIENSNLAMVDVGQGEGILLETQDGSHYFFDGGSTDISQVGTYRILPYLKSRGVRQVDYWFVSHTDQDHISGLEEILEAGYPVKNLCLGAGMVWDDTSAELVEMAEAAGTRVHYLEPGNQVAGKDYGLTCIFPAKENSYTDKNQACLVMEYQDQTGMDILFPGDLESDGEEELLDWGALKHYELLMVGHHGSKTSCSPEFLEMVSPEYALISAGIDNSYGHPAAQTLEALGQYTDQIYVTQTTGCIEVSWDLKKGIKVCQFLTPIVK